MQINIEIHCNFFEEGTYMRPEMKVRFVMKKFLFTLLFIAGEMKINFVSGWSM